MPFKSSPRRVFRALALLSLIGLAACSEEGEAAKAAPPVPPTTVSIVTVRPEAVAITNELPGRIAPIRIAEVRPRVSGIVVERVFKQGSMVREGEVLYRIDPAPFRLQVASARATLQRAEATQLQARQQADRSRALRVNNVTSAQALDNSVAAHAQATADVALARAALSSTLLDLEYAEVKAPIAGRIGRALITEGALVGGTNVDHLATIQQLDRVYADFTQSANDLMRLRRALQAGALTDGGSEEASVRLLLDDGTIYPHAGRLLFSEAAVDATTGQVTLRGEFPNPDGDLLPGMYVRVLIEQGVQQNTIAVPQQAVQRDGGGQGQIHVVTAEGKVEVRPIKAGRTTGDRWVIDEGLKAGDRVIVEGFQKIRPGAKVVAEEWTPAGPSASPRVAE